MANQRRIFKLGERIQGLIASELLRMADPRFFLVTITSVIVSPDMRHAKVYWAVTGDDKERRQEVADAFEGSQGFFRKALSSELGIRFIPVLRFYFDDTLDVSAEVDKLFSRIASETAKHNQDNAHEDEQSN
jgi:ribosome-binding factor A